MFEQFRPQNLELVSLVLIPVAGYQNPVHRPYEVRASQKALNEVAERLERSHWKPSTMTFAGIASEILTTSHDDARMINIPNGFREKRYSFILTMLSQNRSVPAKNKIVVQGFTEYADQSYAGTYSDDMIFYINTIVTTAQTTHYSGPNNTPVVTERIVDSYQVIQGQMVRMFNSTENTMMMRPCDVMDRTSVMHIEENLDVAHDGIMIPGSMINTDKNKTNTLKNNSPAYYLSRTIDSWNTAQQMSELDFNGFSHMDSIAGSAPMLASNALEEPRLKDCPFITALETATGYQAPVSFSMQTLMRIFPNVDDFITEFRYGRATRLTVAPEDSQTLAGVDYITMMVNIIAQALPPMAVSHNFSTVGFTITNRTLDGSIASTATVPPVSLVDDGQDVQRFSALLTRFEKEVFSELLNKVSHVGIALKVYYAIGHDIQVTIHVDGGNEEVFVVPAFCDSLYTPTMAFDPTKLDSMAQGFDMLLNGVTEKQHQTSVISQPPQLPNAQSQPQQVSSEPTGNFLDW